ncbi:MFS transporter [Rhodococcoides trifolii]|uniref:MFS transporter n=1 Tax=Rhodococcoides trifolii TaxID=908250 RepID=A0A917G7L1_9NOCA|nr:MFS transporter [Rhodococcus trifolii]GGG25935.1 MFS transporter [Rhodococcus trifolii]
MTRPKTVGLFTPLRVPRFRMMLGFELSASVGVWVLVLAAQWILTESGESATTVAAVQFAASVPFFLFALPLGAVAEYVGHRFLLVGTSAVLLVAAVLLSLLQHLGLATTPVLMLAVFGAGSGLASVAIVWQALLPHLVTREMMTVVPAIDGAVFNGARAIGPVVGGAVLAVWGPTWTFVLVAGLFAACVAIAARQVPAASGRNPKQGSVVDAVGGSLRFIRHSRWTRRLLLRVIMFGIPASSLWALLPVVANERLHATTLEFGLLSGAIGIGAVAGTIVLMPVRARISWNGFVALGSAAYAVVLAGLASIPHQGVAFALLVVVGAAWVGVQSTWMIATHAVMPPWVKARVIAFVMLTFQGSQAVGALLWGLLTDHIGLIPAMLLSACLMLMSAGEILRRGILPSETIAPDPSGASAPSAPPGNYRGQRVIVETVYTVRPGRTDRFIDDVAELKRSRLRLGAVRWTLAASASSDESYVEFCTYKNWSDYLAQETTRLTIPESRVRQRVIENVVRSPEVSMFVVFGRGEDVTR